MKIIDEIETKKKQQKTKQTEKNKGNASYSERVRAN